jgi:hypothetical protein
MSEASSVKEMLSLNLGAPFRIGSPEEYDPAFDEHPKWFVMCPDILYIKETAHARAAWESQNGNLSIGSHILVDGPALVESLYGEGHPKLPELDYSNLSQAEFESEFVGRFPLVLNRLGAFKSVASRISTEYGVHLELKRSRSEEIFVLTLVARIEAKELESKPLQELVENGLRALKEAYDEIMKLQS